MIKPIRLLLIAAALLPSAANAASFPFDLQAKLEVIAPPGGVGTVTEGTKVIFRCRWTADRVVPLSTPELLGTVPAYSFTVQEEIDGVRYKVLTAAIPAKGKPPHQGVSQQHVWEAAGAGAHQIRCNVAPKSPEAKNNKPNVSIVKFHVKKPPPHLKATHGTADSKETLARPHTPTANAGQKIPFRTTGKPASGLAKGFTGDVKSCMTSLSATVNVAPHQFAHPAYGPADLADTNIMLHLQDSEAAGNSVLCHYASQGKDVPNLVVTVKCPNASPYGGKPHTYGCAS